MEYHLPPLRDLLAILTVDTLKAYAKRCLTHYPTRKAELIERIVQALTNETTLKELWHQLDGVGHSAVAEALVNKGQLDVVAFEARYGTVPTARPWSWQHWSSSLEVRTIDLFLYTNLIPREMFPILQRFVPRPAPYELPTLTELPPLGTDSGTALNTAPAALHDLVATLRLVADGKAAVSAKTGRPTATTITRLRERLLIGDYLPTGDRAEEALRPFGLIMLIQMAQLAVLEGSKLQLSRKGETWLREAAPAGLKSVWTAYISANRPDELGRIRAIHGQGSKDTHLTPPSERKQAILATLRRCPLGQWIAVSDLSQAMRVWQTTFAVERGPYSGLYIGSSIEYGQMDATTYWNVVNYHYLLVVLWEYVATLGLIDVAYIPAEAVPPDPALRDYIWDDDDAFSRYDGLSYIRINNLGAFVLGYTPTYVPEVEAAASQPLVVLANLDVVVREPEALLPNDRILLARITTSTTPNVYSLDRERTLATLADGITFDVVRDFLTTRSTMALPQTVTTWLGDIERNSRRVEERGPALLFEVDDPILAVQFSNDATLRRFCLLAPPQTLVVLATHEAAFRRRLRQLGYGIAPKGIKQL